RVACLFSLIPVSGRRALPSRVMSLRGFPPETRPFHHAPAPRPPCLGTYLLLPYEEQSMRAKRLTAQQKKEIFHALVSTQDLGIMTVAESLKHVAEQFDITEPQLRQIEDEGIDGEWPPLDEAVQTVGQ